MTPEGQGENLGKGDSEDSWLWHGWGGRVLKGDKRLDAQAKGSSKD